MFTNMLAHYKPGNSWLILTYILVIYVLTEIAYVNSVNFNALTGTVHIYSRCIG